MKMVIDEETLLRQLRQIEQAIDQKLCEINDLHNMLNATKALLNTYKETSNNSLTSLFSNPMPPSPFSNPISTPTNNPFSGSIINDSFSTLDNFKISSISIPNIQSTSTNFYIDDDVITSNSNRSYDYEFFSGSKIGGGTSIDALKVILEKGPQTMNEITEQLLEMGHFRDNVHPRSSVHVTLTRRKDLFEKIQVRNEIKWKLKK